MRFALLIAALAASGCAITPQSPQEVRIPVAVHCEAPNVPEPVYPLDQLTGVEDVFQVTRALWSEVDIRQAYEERLRAAVDACRAKAARSP